MTIRLSLILAGLATLWLGSGCGTLNRMQFAVVPPPAPLGTKTSLTEADQAKVLQLISETAARLRLVDRTSTSMVPNTLALFHQLDSDNPIRLIAWRQDDRILIDFMHASEPLGESTKFRQARERLLQDLRDTFGARVQVVPLGKQNSPAAAPAS